MIIAGTGHRPDKLGGFNARTEHRLLLFALDYLMDTKPSRVISGMAQGWDQALAKAAITMNIPLHCAVPFSGQESMWPAAAQRAYNDILRCADQIITVNPGGYHPGKMQLRNIWMVDNCCRVAALWDGSPGGTCNCVMYAQSTDKPVDNLWSRWVDYHG